MKPYIALFVVVLVVPVRAEVAFAPIGVPPPGDPQNPPFSDAYGVANNGTVAGSMYVPGTGFRSFRWTSATGLVDIGVLTPTSGSFARAITPDAQVIVGESTNPNVAYRKIGNNPLENLSFPQTGDYDQSAAYDVSDNGLAIAGLLSRVADGTYRAARWHQNTGWQDLGVLNPDDYESVANTISADGSMLAGYSAGNRFSAFRWTAADHMTELMNPFGSFDAAAIAMSAPGSVITGQARNAQGLSQAVVWYGDGSSRVLNLLAGFDTASGFGISGDGTLVGGSVAIDQVGADRAVFWTADGQVNDLAAFLNTHGINTTGWSFTAITEVSQNGQYLTGRGIDPAGYMDSFLVQIPEPATLALLLAACTLRRRG